MSQRNATHPTFAAATTGPLNPILPILFILSASRIPSLDRSYACA